MINKLYKMRGYIPDELIDESPYGLCLEERKEKVIVLEFKTKEVDSDDLFSKKRNEFEFIGSHPETYSREKNESKYFFKKVPARGSSEFPTVFMSKKDFTKNANKFINIIKKNNK